MTNSSIYSKHTSRFQFDRFIVQINYQTSFQGREGLVGIGMAVPVVRLGHHGNPNDMIIYVCDRVIIISPVGYRLGEETYDFRGRLFHPMPIHLPADNLSFTSDDKPALSLLSRVGERNGDLALVNTITYENGV